MIRLEESWKELLGDEFEKEYFKSLGSFVRKEYQDGLVYPPPNLIFHALDSLPVSKVKVVILGQDPYHGEGQAHGLSFSVPVGVRIPPSLVNIYKELHADLNVPVSKSGDLNKWVNQGVLLLNSTLTVRANLAGSHQNQGWEQFTDSIIRNLTNRKHNLVYILWGSYAQKKGNFIDQTKNLVIKSAHPSPLSAYQGFFGSRPFSQANRYLIENNLSPINW